MKRRKIKAAKESRKHDESVNKRQLYICVAFAFTTSEFRSISR